MTYKHSNFSEILVPKIWWWINVHRFPIFFPLKISQSRGISPMFKQTHLDEMIPWALLPAWSSAPPPPWWLRRCPDGPRWPVGVLSEDGIPTIQPAGNLCFFIDKKTKSIWFSTLVVIFKGLAERKTRCSRANQFWDIGIVFKLLKQIIPSQIQGHNGTCKNGEDYVSPNAASEWKPTTFQPLPSEPPMAPGQGPAFHPGSEPESNAFKERYDLRQPDILGWQILSVWLRMGHP